MKLLAPMLLAAMLAAASFSSVAADPKPAPAKAAKQVEDAQRSLKEGPFWGADPLPTPVMDEGGRPRKRARRAAGSE